MKRNAPEEVPVRSSEEFATAIVRRWPELAVKPGHEEIENPDSPLSKIRAKCVLTASRAGVLWNCKSGVSYKRFLEESLGRVQRAPFSEFALNYMKQGREMETPIANYATRLMAGELRAIGGGQLDHRSPGPFVSGRTSATPDGLWSFRFGKIWYMLPFEIKFFASKTAVPEDFPPHYIAQVVMQMIHAHTRISIAIGCARDPTGALHYRFWKLRLQDKHIADYKARLKLLKTRLSLKQIPARSANEENLLFDVVVDSTTSATSLWNFILENAPDIVQQPDDADEVGVASI
jgi:hypothetical protein